MKARTTVILLVIVGVLAALIWLLRDKEMQDKNDNGPVIRLFPRDVTHLSIERGELLVACEKTEEGWFVVKPVHARASDGAIEGILRSLRELTRDRAIAPEEMADRELTPEDYGLGDQPRAKCVLGSGRKSVTLLLGLNTPFEDAVYVSLDPSVEVVTTQPGIIALLPERVEDLRERRMFLGGMSDVTRAEIRQSAGGFIRIKKRADDVWIMQQPVNNARLNTARVMQILGRLDNVTAIRFIEDEEHPYGLAEGEVVASATLWTDAGGVRTLLLGGPAGDDTGEVYAACKETGLRCTVDDAILDLLSVKPDALRSRALFTIPHTDVASLVLRDGDRQLVLKRSGDEWSIVEPRHWRADDGIINAIVVGLTAIHIEEFFDNVHTNLAEFGLLETDRSIELSTGSEEAERLLIGRSTEDGKSMFVKFAGEKDPVLKAATAVIGSILSGHFGLPEDIDPQPPSPNNGEVPLWISPLRYCDRGMLRLKRSTVTSLQLSKPGVVAQEVRKSADGVWRVVSPEGGVMVEKVVAETLLAASDLRAARVEYRTGVGLSEYGLDHPGISLTFGFAAGNAEGISKTLSMGYLAGDEGMYAMIQGREVVFVLDTETAGRLMRSIVRSPTAGPSGESDAK